MWPIGDGAVGQGECDITICIGSTREVAREAGAAWGGVESHRGVADAIAICVGHSVVKCKLATRDDELDHGVRRGFIGPPVGLVRHVLLICGRQIDVGNRDHVVGRGLHGVGPHAVNVLGCRSDCWLEVEGLLRRDSAGVSPVVHGRRCHWTRLSISIARGAGH